MIERIDPPELGFYAKVTRVHGVAIKAHAAVVDEALVEAARRVDHLLARCPTVVANLERAGVELHLIGRAQVPSDLPMYRHLAGVPFDGARTIDERGRGYGGLHACCDEDHLLGLPSARHRDGRDVCTHELAHAVLAFGLDRATRGLVERRYAEAAPRWAGAYASTNVDEFFAELSMWWVGSRGDAGPLDVRPGPAWLSAFDPASYRLLDRIYRGRRRQQEVEWVDLAPVDADRSARGDTRTDVVFHNRTGAPLALRWLDYHGAPVSYGELPPFGLRAQPTWESHVWVVAGDGGELGRFVAPSGPARVTIGP